MIDWENWKIFDESQKPTDRHSITSLLKSYRFLIDFASFLSQIRITFVASCLCWIQRKRNTQLRKQPTLFTPSGKTSTCWKDSFQMEIWTPMQMFYSSQLHLCKIAMNNSNKWSYIHAHATWTHRMLILRVVSYSQYGWTSFLDSSSWLSTASFVIFQSSSGFLRPCRQSLVRILS